MKTGLETKHGKSRWPPGINLLNSSSIWECLANWSTFLCYNTSQFCENWTCGIVKSWNLSKLILKQCRLYCSITFLGKIPTKNKQPHPPPPWNPADFFTYCVSMLINCKQDQPGHRESPGSETSVWCAECRAGCWPVSGWRPDSGASSCRQSLRSRMLQSGMSAHVSRDSENRSH